MGPKRKRAATLPSNPATAPLVQQETSRDASEEDVEDPTLAQVTALKHKQEEDGTDTKHSIKRRGSIAVPGTSSVKKASLTVMGDEDVHMDDVPKAGTVDPQGGYHTNAPPKDRTVRVYADGVFDLFHLG